MTTLFLSYASPDLAVAREVHGWLTAASQGYACFLAPHPEDGQIAGHPWWPQQSEQLRRTSAFVALVSSSWTASRRCFEELTIARHEGKPIIVVRLDDSQGNPDLRAIHQLDFRNRDPAAWQQLRRALDDAGANPTVFKPDPGRPPFPGLLAFDVEDAALYFGRDREIAEVVAELARRRLGRKRLLVIAGASGSGKSSLLRAGVLARVRRRPEDWIAVRPVRPALGFVDGLLRPLERTCAERAGAVGPPRDTLRALLGDTGTPEAFARFLRDWFGASGATPLIAIDQGEELLSRDSEVEGEETAAALARLLADDSPVLATMTIRSDRLGALQQHPVLGPLMIDEVYSLLPLSRERYGLIIDGPIRQYARHVQSSAAIEPAVSDALIASTAGADALPMIAFVLGTLWDEARGRDGRITLGDLQRLGSVDDAVAAIAAAAVAEAAALPAGCDLDAVHRAFVPGLAGATATGEVVRRRAPEAGLPPAARPLLDRFVERRLLVRGDRGGASYLEIAHEALLRRWPLLVAWLREDLEVLRILELLGRAAQAWRETARSPDLLVHRGEVLVTAQRAAANELFARRFPAGDEQATVSAYLSSCVELERTVSRRILAGEIALAAVMFERAQREASGLRHVQAAALLGAALHVNPYLRAATQVEQTCSPEEVDRAQALSWQARSELHRILPRVRYGFELRAQIARARRLVFDPSGDILTALTGSQAIDVNLETHSTHAWMDTRAGEVLDYAPEFGALVEQAGRATLVDRRTGAAVGTVSVSGLLGEDERRVWHARITPEGAAVLLLMESCIHIDFEREEATVLKLSKRAPHGLLYSLAVTEGQVAIGAAQEIHVVGNRRKARSWSSGQPFAIDHMVFDRPRRRLLFGGGRFELMALDLQSGETSSVGAHNDAVSAIAVLEQQGLTLAGDMTGRAVLRDAVSGQRYLELLATGRSVTAVGTSSDDERIAIASDTSVTVWRSLRWRAPATLRHGNRVMAVAFDLRAADRLYSAGFVGESCAAVWTKAGDHWSKVDVGVRKPYRGVAVAPRGDRFALCGDLADVCVYAADGTLVRRFRSEGSFDTSDRSPPRDDDGPHFVPNVSIAHDAARIAWTAPTGKIWIGEIATGLVVVADPPPGSAYSTVLFSPIEDAAIAVTKDGVVYRLGSEAPLASDAVADRTFGKGTPMAFSADGRWLAYASGGRGITVVETSDPSVRRRLEGHTEIFGRGASESVAALAFDPQGRFLASGGSRQSGGKDPRTVRLWDLETGQQLLRIFIDSDCLALAVDPFSDTLAIGCDHVLLVPFERWLLDRDTEAIQLRTEGYLGTRADSLL